MSRRLNGFEQNLKNRLQMQMSKREAEEAVLEIRENLYGDEYIQIHPMKIVGEYGKVEKKWPEMRYLIWSYFHDDYRRLRKELEEGEKLSQKKETKQLLPKRKNLLIKEEETPKQYNKRFRRENPYNIYNVAAEWHSVSFEDIKEAEKFFNFAKEYGVKLRESDLIEFEYAFNTFSFFCDGTEAIQIVDTAKKEGISFKIRGVKVN